MKQRAKGWAIGLALTLGAVALGLGSAWWVVWKAPWLNTSVSVGAWKANMRAGSPDADMYTRASVALNALLALGRNETLYFIATHDDLGRALQSQCSYRVEGMPPKARWWSVTAYADDLFLFDAPNQHYSLNGSTVVHDAQGRIRLTTGTQAADATLQAAPPSLQAPSILRIGDYT